MSICRQARYCLRGRASDPRFRFALIFALVNLATAKFLAAFIFCQEANLLATTEAFPQPSQPCMQGNFSHRLVRKRIPPLRSGTSSEIPRVQNLANNESVPAGVPKLFVLCFTAAQGCREAMSNESANVLGFADDATRICCKLLSWTHDAFVTCF